MALSFEDKLIALSSEETLKAAKLLLKQKRLSGAFRESDSRVRAIFNENKRYIRVAVSLGDNPAADCDCDYDGDAICPHAVATILYNSNFSNKRPTEKAEASGAYAGMKRESLDELLTRASVTPKAQLHIRADAEFPHVPSKWENSILSVRLKTAQREYVGSINNLRQLYFDKSLAITLKFEDFSLQDRQIIQFLAINAEPENSQLLMNSEVTAEFFHCLGGFGRFTRNGRRLIIHDIPARAAIIQVKNHKEEYFSPGIIYNQAPLEINSAKVIVGRSGCWVGRDGEYFFIPGTVEINWLRNFYRLGIQQRNNQNMQKMLESENAMLPVVKMENNKIAELEAAAVVSGRRTEDHALRLSLQYFYEDVLLPADGGRLAVRRGSFFKRDEAAEFGMENALKMMKCQEDGNEYILDDPEIQGMFLDEMLPAYLKSSKKLLVSDTILRLCGSHMGINAIQLHCSVEKRLNDSFLVNYKLTAEGEDLPLLSTIRTAKKSHRYFMLSSGNLAKLSPELSRFLLSLEVITGKIDEKKQQFEVPICQVHFYRFMAEKIPTAIPQEFYLVGVDSESSTTVVSTKPYEFVGSLRSYQTEGVSWMRNMFEHNFNFVLADEMGLGKTVQLLNLIATYRRRDDAPVMVICPASLVENWIRECSRFVPEFRSVGLAGGARDEVYEHITDYDFIAISYATARHDIDILKKMKFSVLVLDEAQHIKNADTANAQSCKAISANHKAILTGTPLENSPEDLWSLFDFLHPGFLGSFSNFKQRYTDISKDINRQKELSARVAPFIKRRLKLDVCKELPQKLEQTLLCNMSESQRTLYDEVRERGLAQLRSLEAGSKKVPFEILTTLLRLRQICCHPPLIGDDGTAIPSAKMDLVKELILEHIDSGNRMLLFSQFTSLLSYIKAWLDESGIAYEYLDGATRNRQQRVDNFNESPEIPIFLLSLKAGGTGLNLTSADTVIIYDPWWNPAVEAQATDRAHRIGQKKRVSSLKLLVKDSIEERIFAMKRQKQEIFDTVIENPEAASEKLSLKEIEYLFG